ncbi:intradiol ring-cleavage dioxygenase [Sphingomonas sp. RT2P30]|uniref:dioxygenase family protein n=1 Tax=Parasphingomonas halimpatiens TaxID=3096162 RepID=UPI002FC93DC6
MPHDHRHDDHDLGLTHDLRQMAAMLERRRALKWFAGAGTAAIIAGCSGCGASSTDSTVVTGATATPSPTPSPTPTPTATTAASCIVDPTETSGPYPADGTNTSSGTTSNALASSGIVRSDIRGSFISSTTVAGGVQVSITLTLVNVNAACAPLLGYAVYLWHCDRSGNYSLYTAPAESYLRGVQVTNAAGQVTFSTIFPGCYSGRWPHIHFEVFSSLSAATSGRYAVLVSQLALPAAVSSTIYADTTTYPSSKSNFAAISLASDNVFGDNTTAQIAQQTPTMNGSATAGYTATAVVGLAL